MTALGRLIWFIGAIIITLLLLRFFFILFGADPLNRFVDFVYDTSSPLVSPFFGLFNYDYVVGRATFELPTLVAIVVYTLIASILSWLFKSRVS